LDHIKATCPRYHAERIETAVDAALAEGLVDGDTFKHGPVQVKIVDGQAIGTAPNGQTKALPLDNAAVAQALIISKALWAAQVVVRDLANGC
jgi:hypothetical protein